MACAAGMAVLEVMKNESLMQKASEVGAYLKQGLKQIPKIKKIKGKGLMLGVEFDFPIKQLRKDLVYNHQVFTGASSNTRLLRILPPLVITHAEADLFLNSLQLALST